MVDPSLRTSPLQRLIAFCAHNALLTILVVAALAAWGYRSLVNTPLDAIPDLSDVQVIVFTDWPGRSPDLVEDQITYPLTTTLLAAPDVRFVRGQSFMGLSFVYVIFEDSTDMYWARSRVLEYLNSAAPKLPDSVRPTLGPDATGVGWVYQYALVDKTGQQSLADLRAFQDFNLRYALESVEGVAEVAAVGGFVKEYQINIDPNKLASYNIPLRKVTAAVRDSNNDVGGRVLEIAGHEQFIRGRGYVTSIADLEEVVIGLGDRGIPVRVADVATVSLGPALQRGQADLDGEGITVGGIVIMRYGENALAVIDRVKVRIEELKRGLPTGVEIVPVYDRSSLIDRAIDTLRNILVEEMLIVALVIGVFLLHVRSALVAIMTLPIAILLSFIPMFYQGLTANIMSLAVLLIRGRIRGEDSWLNRSLVAGYASLVRLAVRWRWPVVIAALLAVVATVPVYRSLGNEFMPPLNEGSLLYMPTTLPGISIEEATRVLQTMDRELKKFPEVERVFGKVGRSSSPTDLAPLSMIEANIMLKPESAWRDGMTWDKLIGEMDSAMRFPGMPNVWWMPIQTRTEMLATGIRSTLGIKVFGPDLAIIEQTAIAIERALQADERTAPHTRSAFAERATGGYFLDFDIDRAAAARFGLNVGDVQSVIEAAMGGVNVGETVEGRERYGILVRYAREYRDNLEALERVFVTTSTGAQIPITQVAEIVFRTGPPALRNEDGQLVSFVFVDVDDEIGIADYVDSARQVVAESVEIPTGYRLAWAGQFTYFERARDRLAMLVPLTILVIFIMLYMHRKSLTETLIVMMALPFSAIGSIWLLAALDYNLSVAVAVGMIAVAGLAVELGLLMMLYLDLAWRGHIRDDSLENYADLIDTIAEGASQRIRPMLMTSLTLLIGLTPLMLSSGSGADVMKRIAAPMLGGVGSALLLVLIVIPALFAFWRGREVYDG